MSLAKFDRFPLDGRLYRLISCGKVVPATPDMATPRIQVYLARMDEPESKEPESQEPEIESDEPECEAEEPGLELKVRKLKKSKSKEPTYARDSSGSVVLEVLDEAAGSIPTLILGSLWRDQTLQPDYILPQSVLVQDAVLPIQEWRLTTLWRAASADGHVDRLPTSGRNQAGHPIELGDMPVLHCHTDTGLNLFIPCYEVFRRYFGLSTELANAFLSSHWMHEVGRMVNMDTTQLTSEGDFEIEPVVHLSNVACRAIALFLTSAHAKAQASQIYLDLDNARRTKVHMPWLAAMPPWKAESMQLSFIGEELSKSSVLVLWIHDSQFPHVEHPIKRLSEETVLQPSPEATTGPLKPVLEKADEGDEPQISTPQDARLGKKALHISVLDTWSRLPPLPRKVISRRVIPHNPEKPETESTVKKRRFVTGKRSASGETPAASLSSEEQARIQDRFLALATCFTWMVNKRLLSSFSDYGVVNPVETPGATYCALPTNIGGIPRPWAFIDDRPRMCWVVELVRADKERFYWLEVESRGILGHRALLVRMTDNSATLPASVVERLFKTIVVEKGVWKPEQLLFNESSFRACKVTHRFEKQMVKPSLIQAKMAGLLNQHPIA